jgi:hypothetical protein
MSIRDIQQLATLCRKRAETKTGSAQERELSLAKDYEAIVRARRVALNLVAL